MSTQFFNFVNKNLEKVPIFRSFSQFFDPIEHPSRILNNFLGIEEFDFPGTSQIIHLIPSYKPDIIHCHNLHGGYFDLRMLPQLSKQIPVVITLHDAWLLSGHCAHSFDCERWKTGCGNCPDLSIPYSIRRDASAYNWRRKKNIFSRSQVFVTTPSRWLMDKVEQSMLAPAIIEKRVIPNGVDLSIFQPADPSKVRGALGLPEGVLIVLFAANGIRASVWKDYSTMKRAIGLVSEKMAGSKLLFLALGENAPDEHAGSATIRFVPYERDMKMVACYYQAADLYVHAARADTFPNTVLEALACGIPVVATAVGGIPEQIHEGKTGFLTPPGDASAMAGAIQRLLEDPDLRKTMGEAASREAQEKFSLDLQAGRFLDLYDEIVSNWK